MTQAEPVKLYRWQVIYEESVSISRMCDDGRYVISAEEREKLNALQIGESLFFDTGECVTRVK